MIYCFSLKISLIVFLFVANIVKLAFNSPYGAALQAEMARTSAYEDALKKTYIPFNSPINLRL